MRVAIIIPFYNGDEYIEKCLDSIQANDNSNVSIYIINNSDRATKVHSYLQRYKMLRIIDTKPRIGFSGANNIGANIAIAEGAEIIVSLNQDTILAKNCLEKLLLPLLSNQQIAIVAPITHRYDFKCIDERFIKYYLSQCPELFCDALSGSIKDLYLVEKVSGACLAIRTETIRDYGYFDPLYFMYSEDDDLCRRIRYGKGCICIAPSAKVAHLHSNRMENCDHVDKRYSWQRHSRAIYELKRLDKPLYYNLFKVIGNNSIDYLKAILTLRMSKVFDYLLNDIRILIKYPRITKARRYERALREKHISKNIICPGR
jgi:GT2 family glycosyltransferase